MSIMSLWSTANNYIWLTHQPHVCSHIKSSLFVFPSLFGHHRALSSLCYRVGSHQLSVLYLVSIVYIHQSTSEIDGEVESLEDGLIQSSDFQTVFYGILMCSPMILENTGVAGSEYMGLKGLGTRGPQPSWIRSSCLFSSDLYITLPCNISLQDKNTFLKNNF